MVTILIRTMIVYAILIGTMRFMGKRQLGELEITELVTTLFLSEIATLPIGNPTIPIIYAVIPLLTILTLEITLSVVLLKCPKLKNIASARPSVLIRHGKIDQKELQRIRISVDELISEIRQEGLSTFAEVDYAILEQNGKISVIPKKNEQPLTPKDAGLQITESGILHALIEDGTVNKYNMKEMNLDLAWLTAKLQERSLTVKQVFFLGIDDAEQLYWVEKENQK